MRMTAALLALTWALSGPTAARACGAALCLVDPESVGFARVIAFDDLPSGNGPGRPHAGPMARPGATFGERLAGQELADADGFDTVTGRPLPPLTLLPGGTELTVTRVYGTTLLNGLGPTGYPRDDAVGEGAIAWRFDRDQPGFELTIRGGEDGTATIAAFARDGRPIGTAILSGLAENRVAVLRDGLVPDIAAVVLTNRDPAGIALERIRFEISAPTS